MHTSEVHQGEAASDTNRAFAAQETSSPTAYIPLAQSANAPIIALKARDGLVGSQFSQAADYKEIIGNLANEIYARLA